MVTHFYNIKCCIEFLLKKGCPKISDSLFVYIHTIRTFVTYLQHRSIIMQNMNYLLQNISLAYFYKIKYNLFSNIQFRCLNRNDRQKHHNRPLPAACLLLLS